MFGYPKHFARSSLIANNLPAGFISFITLKMKRVLLHHQFREFVLSDHHRRPVAVYQLKQVFLNLYYYFVRCLVHADFHQYLPR